MVDYLAVITYFEGHIGWVVLVRRRKIEKYMPTWISGLRLFQMKGGKNSLWFYYITFQQNFALSCSTNLFHASLCICVDTYLQPHFLPLLFCNECSGLIWKFLYVHIFSKCKKKNSNGIQWFTFSLFLILEKAVLKCIQINLFLKAEIFLLLFIAAFPYSPCQLPPLNEVPSLVIHVFSKQFLHSISSPFASAFVLCCSYMHIYLTVFTTMCSDMS